LSRFFFGGVACLRIAQAMTHLWQEKEVAGR
jgi:hypothetical protein